MQAWNPTHVSLETIVAASPLLGHELEDRSRVRFEQDLQLASQVTRGSAVSLRSMSQCDTFCVAPLDILVSQEGTRKQFHLLELNGTGIGGLTNLPDGVVCEILQSLAETADIFDQPDGLVLLAVSGRESLDKPRLNRLMHEKLLFVEALRRGLVKRHGSCDAWNLDTLRAARGHVRSQRPGVVIGYMKELLAAIEMDEDGGLWLHGRPVVGAVNDRFCRNLLQHFDEQVDLTRFQAINRCFAAGSDKGLAYGLMNEFVRKSPRAALPAEVHYEHAYTRNDLIRIVFDWLDCQRQVVIKPHGTGLGHGIEFFLHADESREAVVSRIDQSLKQTEEYYGTRGGALPYTVCEFVDADRIDAPGHAFDGHKYELRVVVYRQGRTLRAFPSIAKIARERCELGTIDRRSLINNITASGDTQKVCGTDYMLPLCQPQTLSLLGLSTSDLQQLCEAASHYVRYVLDQTEDAPERFGLPSAPVRMAETQQRVAA
jgi:hypothetical protein